MTRNQKNMKKKTTRPQKTNSAGTLFVVGTPIGNLSDMSERAIETLRQVKQIYCEDTRVSRKLLSHFGITGKELERADANKCADIVEKLLISLNTGVDCALITDSGTPGVSDPGAFLVSVVRDAGYNVMVIPGPSAITSALSVSGFSADQFVFLGFPPRKKGRKTFFKNIKRFEDMTIVIYESPHRILQTLGEIEEVMPEVNIVICREMTKIFEEVKTGTASELYKYFQNEKPRGEFVIVIG